MSRETVAKLWEVHKNDDWPRLESRHEGPLMTLDTVICGCVVYFLDSEVGLDEQRRAMVGDCLVDLAMLEMEIEDESRSYFHRLQELGTLLIGEE